MVGTITGLLLAMVAFIGSHVLLSSHPVRGLIVRTIGERLFLGMYSLVSLALIVWVAKAYGHAPVLDVWQPPTGFRHLSLTIMPIACILVVAGASTSSPAAISLQPAASAGPNPIGIQRVTRHPVMWGIALWGIAHLLANGDAASCILFSGFTALALIGAMHIDARRHRLLGDAWQHFVARTSFVPLAAFPFGHVRTTLREIGGWRILAGVAVYALLLWAHPWLFGVDVWPL